MLVKKQAIAFIEDEEVEINNQTEGEEMEKADESNALCHNNKKIRENIMEPLCRMRHIIAESKKTRELDQISWTYDQLLDYFERSCDQLWKSLNL